MPKFPKRTQSKKVGDIGVNKVSGIVNDDLGWIFRRNPQEYDFGVDGYIDIVESDGSVTGRTIAVQIKTGTSYFKKDQTGDIVFSGEFKHLNYFSNLNTPIILVLHNPDTDETVWAEFNLASIESSPSSWKLWISEKSYFDLSSVTKLKKIAGEPEDFTALVKDQSLLNSAIRESNFIWYAIDHDDIVECNTSNFESFIERLTFNRSLLRHSQGCVEISVSGYDFNPRELWEIKEVRNWFAQAYGKIDSWFYFLRTKEPAHGFRLLFTSIVSPAKILSRPLSGTGKIHVEFKPEEIASFVDNGWPGLNRITDELSMSMDENKRISYSVLDVLNIPHD